MPTIGEALAEGEQALPVSRAAELRLFERWLDDPRPPELLEVSGPGGIGKTSLLAAFRRLVEARGRAVVEADLRAAAGNPIGVLGLLGGTDRPRLPRSSITVGRSFCRIPAKKLATSSTCSPRSSCRGSTPP